MKNFINEYLSQIEIHDRRIAGTIVWLIPASCPFARSFYFLGRRVTIPPLCKINPIYDGLMVLRFHAQQACGEVAEHGH